MSLEEIVSVTKATKDAGVPIDRLAYNALEKPTTELGEGLGNLFWLAFSPLHVVRASLEPRINQFKRNLENKLSTIPPGNLIEPPLNIAGPALEAAKYYIEDENLREMFANLIASAMNSEKTNITHPAFVEIIKQLSSFDAQILMDIVEYEASFPIGRLQINTYQKENKNRYLPEQEDSFSIILTHIMPFDDLSIDNAFFYSASIDNLCRLSLIEVDYSNAYKNTEIYDSLINHVILDQFRDQYKNQLEENKRIELRKGIWSFTQLGKLFIEACLPDETIIP
ncbi:DUF4393 domain-containing protein [Paenibacillus fonticola]|uniref:DUF4393 domain-containing protein n=1 Tax=Paenibacillus fonticola TaxID=379896 RepID=UPI0003603624|nr:DUF4393 domain-containing protein [Paenibacillus fonticola]